MKEVALSVVMCTFNGAPYLREQLDSIARQTLLPGELLVWDDRSDDGTANIVRAFAATAPFAVRLHINEQRYGVVRNFESAIGQAQGRYVALSDQDDVWRDDKLSREMELLAQVEAETGSSTPILVHSDLELVDQDLQRIQSSMFRAQRLRPGGLQPLATLLVQNYVTGCTVLCNRALIERALPFGEQVVMHDWWLALCAAAFGEVRTLPASTVLYRQHQRNQVGAGTYGSLVVERVRAAFGMSSSRAARAVSFGRKLDQAGALRSRMKSAPPGAVTGRSASLVDCFVSAFSPQLGRLRRVLRVLACPVAPQTLLLRVRYILQALAWPAKGERRDRAIP